MSSMAEFEALLQDRLLPEFCADPDRRCSVGSYKGARIAVTEEDARDFMRAWNGGLLHHQGRGLYRAARNHGQRLWRVAENLQAHAGADASDDRLVHLMSRVGLLAGGMANDLRSGHLTSAQTSTLLEQLAELSDIALKHWSSC